MTRNRLLQNYLKLLKLIAPVLSVLSFAGSSTLLATSEVPKEFQGFYLNLKPSTDEPLDKTVPKYHVEINGEVANALDFSDQRKTQALKIVGSAEVTILDFDCEILDCELVEGGRILNFDAQGFPKGRVGQFEVLFSTGQKQYFAWKIDPDPYVTEREELQKELDIQYANHVRAVYKWKENQWNKLLQERVERARRKKKTRPIWGGIWSCKGIDYGRTCRLSIRWYIRLHPKLGKCSDTLRRKGNS